MPGDRSKTRFPPDLIPSVETSLSEQIREDCARTQTQPSRAELSALMWTPPNTHTRSLHCPPPHSRGPRCLAAALREGGGLWLRDRGHSSAHRHCRPLHSTIKRHMEKLNHGTRKTSGKLGVGLRRACNHGPPAPSLYPTAHSAVSEQVTALLQALGSLSATGE